MDRVRCAVRQFLRQQQVTPVVRRLFAAAIERDRAQRAAAGAQRRNDARLELEASTSSPCRASSESAASTAGCRLGKNLSMPVRMTSAIGWSPAGSIGCVRFTLRAVS